MPRQLATPRLAAALVAAVAAATAAAAAGAAGTPRVTNRALACPLPGHRVMARGRTAVVFLSPVHPRHGHSLFFEGCLRPRGRPIRLNARGDAPVPGPALAVTEHYVAVNTYSSYADAAHSRSGISPAVAKCCPSVTASARLRRWSSPPTGRLRQ